MEKCNDKIRAIIFVVIWICLVFNLVAIVYAVRTVINMKMM